MGRQRRGSLGFWARFVLWAKGLVWQRIKNVEYAMIFKKLLVLYLMALTLIVVIPLGGFNMVLNHTTVICFRLDNFLHALMFIPLVVLWRLSFPKHHLWIVLTGGIFLASAMEGLQYLLPYRACNINDLLGNGVGVLGGIVMGSMKYGIQKSGGKI